MPARYIGMVIPDCFVVGYGLDRKEAYRQLPAIYVLEEPLRGIYFLSPALSMPRVTHFTRSSYTVGSGSSNDRGPRSANDNGAFLVPTSFSALKIKLDKRLRK